MPTTKVPPHVAQALAFATASATQVKAQRALTFVERYRFDPTSYITDILGWTPWSGDAEHPGQQQVIDAYTLALRQQVERRAYLTDQITAEELTLWQPGMTIKNRIRVPAGHNVGKCVAFTELITLADGKRVEAGDLVGKKFDILTLKPNGLTTTATALAELNSSSEIVYKITTFSGKNIVRNAQHPLWAASVVFCNGRHPKITSQGWTELSKLDSSMLVALTEELPTYGEETLYDEEIKILAYLIGDGGLTSGIIFTQDDNAQLAEFLSCIEAIGSKAKKISKMGYCISGIDNGNNAVLDLCRSTEIYGKNSYNKRVPAVIFSSSIRQIELFLSRLYATDGWASINKPVDNSSCVQIGYSSVSEGLINDVQDLLLRLGVHAVKRKKKTSCGEYKGTAFDLTITNRLDIATFIDNIGIFGKEDAVARVSSACSARVSANLRSEENRPDRPRWIYKNAPPGTRWEKIVSVECISEQATVAIEVPGYETYLTSFYEHNSKLGSGLINHFFDCFKPSVVSTVAPTKQRLHDTLWKDIKGDRQNKGLPGRILDFGLQDPSDPGHFVSSLALNDANNLGSERFQGTHGEYLFWVFDEADGIPDFAFEALDTMMSGGVSIALFLANPHSDSSMFHRVGGREDTTTFQISCLWHPNVLYNKEIVPNSVQRPYIEDMMREHCVEVAESDTSLQTFSVPWQPDKIYRPDGEFMWHVLGATPLGIADKTLIPLGVYQEACKRLPEPIDDGKYVTLGVDVARFGSDFGTLYMRRQGQVRRVAQFSKLDNTEYWIAIRTLCVDLVHDGVQTIDIRVDGGGGFGGGTCDLIVADLELQSIVPNLIVREVQFGGVPYDVGAYADMATQLYAEAAEALKGLFLVSMPKNLEDDLCRRTFDWKHYRGLAVRKLDAKDVFRKKYSRSPDDGDGFVLCVAPVYLFDSTRQTATYYEPVTIGAQIGSDDVFGGYDSFVIGAQL